MRNTLSDVSEVRPIATTPHDNVLGSLNFLTGASAWLPECSYESAWIEHAPFAFWLIEAHAPNVLVELGTHWGYSFFSFCQAIAQLRLGTRAYAIDTWKGDEHAGFYGEEVFQRAASYNDERYSAFARLIRSTFDDALPYFEDGSIDLLHIDGRHFYEDIKHDFDAWVPKLSDRGIVLLHDTNVRERSFGVFRFWAEISERYPNFQFFHGSGLGVLGIGNKLPDALDNFLQLARRGPETANQIRNIYSRLGVAIRASFENQRLLSAMQDEKQQLSSVTQRANQLQMELDSSAAIKNELATLKEAVAAQRVHAEALQAVSDSNAAEVTTAKAALAKAEVSAAAQRALAEKLQTELNSTVAETSATKAALAKAEIIAAAQRTRAEKLQTELNSNAAKASATSAALDKAVDRAAAQRARADQLQAQLESSAASHANLEAELNNTQASFRALTHSTTWRITQPIRVALSRLPSPLRRFLRRGAKAAYWAATPHHIPARIQVLRDGTKPIHPPSVNISPGAPVSQQGATDVRSLFDVEWYLGNNPDVKSSGMDALQHFMKFGWKELRDPNPFFDISWYLERNSDVVQAGINPIEHYINIGWREHRNPGPRFDVKYYLSQNQDVDAAGLEPLWHYLHFGRDEGRASSQDSPQAAPVLRESRPPETDYSLAIPFNFIPNVPDVSQPIAAVCHLFDAELSVEFKHYLSNIPAAVDLFISTDSALKKAQIETIFSDWPNGAVEIRIVEDRGRDIAPRLITFRDVYSKYEITLHLHSKKSNHASSLRLWRTFLLENLIGSQEVILSILQIFKSCPQVGLIASQHFEPVRPWVNWGPNFDAAAELAKRMGLTIRGSEVLDFPSGSMFWARSGALQPLLELNLEARDFPEEPVNKDGTLAHAIERLFFFSCEGAGFNWLKVARPELFSATPAISSCSSSSDVEEFVRTKTLRLSSPQRRRSLRDLPISVEQGKTLYLRRCDLSVFRVRTGGLIQFLRDTEPYFSIVIPAYGGFSYNIRVLELLEHAAQYTKAKKGIGIEVIVIDNGSSDETVNLERYVKGIVFRSVSPNIGFPRACNLGASLASGKYLVFLNNDVEFEPDLFVRLYMAVQSDKESVACFGGAILQFDGSIQDLGSGVWRDGVAQGYYRNEPPTRYAFAYPRDVDYVAGCLYCISVAEFRAFGGFDDRYSPGYYEESDLALRLWKAGRRSRIYPDIRIYHLEFATHSAADPQGSNRLMQKNRPFFVQQHKELLDERPEFSLPQRYPTSHHGTRSRLLFIEDRVPSSRVGVGLARSEIIVRKLIRDIDIEIFACDRALHDLANEDFQYIRIEYGPEPDNLRRLLSSRHYDIVYICRPHNLARYVEVLGAWKQGGGKVIYDSEAIFAVRTVAQIERAESYGAITASQRFGALVQEELRAVQLADLIIAVNELEADIIRRLSSKPVLIIGHDLPTRASEPDLGVRSGLLFVGAMHAKDTPNYESIVWFLDNAWPRIRAARPTETLRIAGFTGPGVSLDELRREGVVCVGSLPELAEEYARSRAFIAPTRFAAGIPFKVHEAFSYGLPVVCSRLLHEQLTCNRRFNQVVSDVTVYDDGREFADACLKLLTDDDLWLRRREAGLAYIADTCFADSEWGQLQRFLREDSTIPLEPMPREDEPAEAQ